MADAERQGEAAAPWAGGLLTDVLRPEGRVGLDESGHQLLTPRVVEHLDLHAAAAQKVFLAKKRPVLAYDDPRDAVEENAPAAHRARGERRVDRAFAVDAGGLAARVLERGHLPVEDRAALLHATVVAAAEDPSPVHGHRADGEPPPVQTHIRFTHWRPR